MLLLSDEHEFCASLIRQAFIAKTSPKNQICFFNQAASIIIRCSYKIISVVPKKSLNFLIFLAERMECPKNYFRKKPPKNCASTLCVAFLLKNVT